MVLSLIPKPLDANGNPFDPSRFPSLSNTTPLGSNAIYTQPWIDSTQTGFMWPDIQTVYRAGTAGPQDVNFVSGSVYSDQAGTVYIEQSDDQVNIQSTSIAVSAATLTPVPLQQLTSRYFRFRYVNGATAQGTFVLSQISERIDAFNQMSITGRKAQQDEPFGASGTSVAAGTDFMVTTPIDLSQVALVNYIYMTTSTGSATTNIYLYTVEGSSNYKNGLVSNIGSNAASKRATGTTADLRGFPSVYYGFRNADTAAITAYLKVCKQW